MKRLTTLILLILSGLSTMTMAQTEVRSVASGMWSGPAQGITASPTWGDNDNNLPNAQSNVIIASGHTVSIPSWFTAWANNVTIEAGASLQLSGPLYYTGTLKNSGNLTIMNNLLSVHSFNSDLRKSVLERRDITNDGNIWIGEPQPGNYHTTINSNIRNSGTIIWTNGNIQSGGSGPVNWTCTGTGKFVNLAKDQRKLFTAMGITWSTCHEIGQQKLSQQKNGDCIRNPSRNGIVGQIFTTGPDSVMVKSIRYAASITCNGENVLNTGGWGWLELFEVKPNNSLSLVAKTNHIANPGARAGYQLTATYNAMGVNPLYHPPILKPFTKYAFILPHGGVHVMHLAGKNNIGVNGNRAITFSQISPQSKNKKTLSETLASYTPAPKNFSLWYQINLIEISSTSQRSSITKKN